MKLDRDMHLDSQCILVVKDRESATCIDYFFEAGLWDKDPRRQGRSMKIAELRGLLRFDKETLGVELLFSMVGDDGGSRFRKAASKVLKEFRSTGTWPDLTQFASG